MRTHRLMKIKRCGLEDRLKEECRLRHLSRMTLSAAATILSKLGSRYNAKWSAPQIYTEVSSKQIMHDELASINMRFHPPETLKDVMKKMRKKKRQAVGR